MYNIRDLLGHFVKIPPDRNEDGMCPHPCCKGKRPHPDRFPVMLPAGLPAQMSDYELERHYQKRTVGDNPRATRQVLGELERRESKRALDLRSPKEQRRDARAQRADEYRVYLEHEQVSAEAATRGNMVNKRGRARGVDPRAFWTNADLRNRYASDELRAWFDRHPVVGEREFHGAGAAAAGARRRRGGRLYGVY